MSKKVSIEDFCRQFYGDYIFGDFGASGYFDTAFKSITEADQSFAVIDQALFRREMTAIWLELFALAWGHKFKKEKFTIPQSIFTRNYLEENKKLELWDIMGEYNQAISDSVTLTGTAERMSAGQVALVNLSRWNMFTKWIEANKSNSSVSSEQEEILSKCVARVINRFDVDVKRNDYILIRRLGARLCSRLECSPGLKSEAISRLGYLIRGLYEGSTEAIKDVSL